MILKRNIDLFLSQWINPNVSHLPTKPIIIEGQRQVGKTTTIKNFFFKNNIDFAYVDLSKDVKIHDIIKRFDIDDLIQWLKVKYGFDKNSPYIFFDEAQHCLQIVQMLKYFRELNPELRIIVAGYLLQLKLFENKEKIMYPTGKVLLVKLNPLSFEEFISNIYPNINYQLIDCFKNGDIDSLNIVYKNKLLNSYYKYLLIGGMPEPVVSYIESIQNNYANVFKKSFNDILTLRANYLEDIRNHFGNITEKNKSEAIFTDLHLQISKENKRFIIANINMKNRENINNRLRDFVIPIRKLMLLGMIGSIEYLTELKEPFNNFVDHSKFKLYYSDISFYTHNYNLSFEQIDASTNDWTIIKSGITENFVFNELNNNYPINLPGEKDWYTYSKNNKNENIEIDFLLYEYHLQPFAIEVKTSSNIKSVSFNKVKKNHPKWNYIKLNLNDFVINDEFINIPIYLIGYFYKYVIHSEDKEIYKKYGLKLIV